MNPRLRILASCIGSLVVGVIIGYSLARSPPDRETRQPSHAASASDSATKTLRNFNSRTESIGEEIDDPTVEIRIKETLHSSDDFVAIPRSLLKHFNFTPVVRNFELSGRFVETLNIDQEQRKALESVLKGLQRNMIEWERNNSYMLDSNESESLFMIDSRTADDASILESNFTDAVRNVLTTTQADIFSNLDRIASISAPEGSGAKKHLVVSPASYLKTSNSV